jgi:transposase
MRKMKQSIVENKSVFVGLEDSKRKWKLCVRSDGMVAHDTSMPTKYDELKAFFNNRLPGCRIRVMYEAGFQGFWLHDRLEEDGIDCAVIPPHLVTEPKVNRVKTDKADARRLAKVLEHHDYRSECFVPDRERREDRQISRTLDRVNKDVKVYRNNIQSLISFHGIATGLPDTKWNKEQFRSLRELPLDEALQTSLKILLDILGKLWEVQIELRQRLVALTKKARYAQTYKIIRSLPGIGWYTAIRLVLELGEDLSRFASGKCIAAFFGLTGRENSTGETVRRGGITLMGNGMMRSWLVEAAWTAIRKDPALLDKYRRVANSSSKKKKAIVAVARILAVRMRACVLSGTPYVLGTIQ